MISNPIKIHRCNKCHQAFEHEETLALFKQHLYHFQCFLCTQCQKPLSHQSFYLDETFQLDISNPQVYCEKCYFQRLPSCYKCQEAFSPSSTIVDFQGKEYHQECFICEQCQARLDEKIFCVKNARFFCQLCLHQLEPCLMPIDRPTETSPCKKCGQSFRSGQSIAQYQYDFYHQSCFSCGSCGKFLVNEGFFRQQDGCLFCLTCQINQGPHCQVCGEPFLTGEILCQFDGKDYHHTCFLCQKCQKPIDKKQFVANHGKIICEQCWTKRY